jgi:hypothetical protein
VPADRTSVMLERLVGLPRVRVLAVDDDPLRVHVETKIDVIEQCRSCGATARVKDRDRVALTDLPCFGRPAVLVWHKRRWRCPERECPTGSWTERAPAIAASRLKLTDRAGRWVTYQVGCHGRTVACASPPRGVCWDNAPAESWFGGFKNELVHPIGAFTTRHEAQVEIARYIRWHNTTRRHSAQHARAPRPGTSPYPDPCSLISRCPLTQGKPRPPRPRHLNLADPEQAQERVVDHPRRVLSCAVRKQTAPVAGQNPGSALRPGHGDHQRPPDRCSGHLFRVVSEPGAER